MRGGHAAADEEEVDLAVSHPAAPLSPGRRAPSSHPLYPGRAPRRPRRRPRAPCRGRCLRVHAQPPMLTVGAPVAIGAPQPATSPTRAAGRLPIMTVVLPVTIVDGGCGGGGGNEHACVSPTTAAGPTDEHSCDPGAGDGSRMSGRIAQTGCGWHRPLLKLVDVDHCALDDAGGAAVQGGVGTALEIQLAGGIRADFGALISTATLASIFTVPEVSRVILALSPAASSMRSGASVILWPPEVLMVTDCWPSSSSTSCPAGVWMARFWIGSSVARNGGLSLPFTGSPARTDR